MILNDTIDVLVRDVPKTINKKLKIKAVKEDKTVSLVIKEILREKLNR